MTSPNNQSTKGTPFVVAAAAAASFASIPSLSAYTVPQMATKPPPFVAPSAPSPSVDERLIDAKLEAVEARTETKFAQLFGKLDLLGQQLTGVQSQIGDLDTKIDLVDAHARSSKGVVIATVIGAAIGIVGLTFAAVSMLQGAMGATASAYQSGMSAATAQQPSVPKDKTAP